MPGQTQRKKEVNQVPNLEELEHFILTEPDPIEIGEGYSISIKYDPEGRLQIFVKKYGNIDTRGLRRRIERSYPGATIQGLEKSKQIMIDHQQPEEHKDPNLLKDKDKVRKMKKQRKPE